MNDHDFEEFRPAAHLEEAAGVERRHPQLAEHEALPRHSHPPAYAGRSTLDKLDYRSGVVWVRASDLLNTGTGRIAGRGLDFEAELARRMRRTPATTRRAISRRAHRLPPLSAFGRSNENTPVAQRGLGRREP